MKGGSSMEETKEGMGIHKMSKLKEEPKLSGTYIRSLVKQLSSSSISKDPKNPKDPDDSVEADGGFNGQNLTNFGKGFSETRWSYQPQPPQQHKKQVRRRLPASRPCQGRPLNMAEARREIVTALKFHRAAMKQANEQQQHLSQPSQLPSPSIFEQQSMAKSRGNPRICPSSASNFPNPYYWPASDPIPVPSTDNLNFTLSNQTLGLNLNSRDFNNIDAKLYQKSNNLSIYSSSVAIEEVTSVAVFDELGPIVMGDLTECYGGGGLKQALDNEGMAETRSSGEQHQMEWDDPKNLATSARWFKFLKTMELGPALKADANDTDGFQPFDQVMEMEFPAWLKANDSCFHHHFDDVCPDDYFQVHALPCLEIGEIEGMDGEWLA